jgi:hypothetical protein
MREPIRFAHLLPLLALALLVLLVLVPVTVTALHLYQAAGSSPMLHVHTAQIVGELPRSQIVPLSIRIVTMHRAALMRAINLPGALPEAALSLAASGWPLSGWHPPGLLFETWSALVYPFFALPFWWLAGRGLDALLLREPLPAALSVAGAVLGLLAAGLALHLWHGAGARPDLEPARNAALAWAAAFAVLPLAHGIARRPIAGEPGGPSTV